MLEKSKEINKVYNQRRSYRMYDRGAVIDQAVIENCIMAASSAPSGANQQGYTFVVIKDSQVKQQVRAISEENERAFYENENNSKWHDDLKKLKTGFSKPFLTDASYLIAIFYHNKTIEGGKIYYPMHGVGLATGMLLSALNQVGLDTLTYTPSKMTFMKEILNRKEFEVPYMVVAVGRGSSDYQLPKIKRKTKEEIIEII